MVHATKWCTLVQESCLHAIIYCLYEKASLATNYRRLSTHRSVVKLYFGKIDHVAMQNCVSGATHLCTILRKMQGGHELPCLFNYYFDYVLKMETHEMTKPSQKIEVSSLNMTLPFLLTLQQCCDVVHNICLVSSSGVGSRGATGAAAPLTFYLGGARKIARPPLKTDMVTLCKGFSNFCHCMYLHFKIKIYNIKNLMYCTHFNDGWYFTII